MRSPKLKAFAALLCVALGACAAGPASSGPPAGTPGGAETCSTLQNGARDEVNRALEANLACTTDADCIEDALSAGCFDSCSRVVNKSGKAAVDAARAKVDAGACAKFKAQGCTMTIPPCMPPGAPHCKDKSCSL